MVHDDVTSRSLERTGSAGDTLELRALARGLRRRWWLPVLLAALGVVVGATAAENVPPVYRSTATVLVGPTDGAVTHSSTVRTSEDLAVFYADMARRQIVLGPVVETLGLPLAWDQLRTQVGAEVPKENPRLISVTVVGPAQRQTDRIANALVRQLVSLSPAAAGGSVQAFVNEQTESLKSTIEEGQERIQGLEAAMAATADPDEQKRLEQEIARHETLVGEWRRTYVELIAAEPSTGAGGMQVIDEANAVTDKGRFAANRQMLIGGGVGAAAGVLLSWLLLRRDRRRAPSHVREAADRPLRTHFWDAPSATSDRTRQDEHDREMARTPR